MASLCSRDPPHAAFLCHREVHVSWEKFTNYFEVEPRWVDCRKGCPHASAEDLVAACDENTIGEHSCFPLVSTLWRVLPPAGEGITER
jgi:glutamate/tyrosine decarboxylase-like PLP-dependent enzyme